MKIIVKNNDLLDFGKVLSDKVIRIDYEEGCDPTYAMKVDTLHNGCGDPCNCIDLEDGSWFHMKDNEKVTVLHKVSLVIE